MGTIWGTEMTDKVEWHVVKQYAGRVGILKLAPHDLRRSCPRLCHSAGGELEQPQSLLGDGSVQTTEKYYVRQVDMCSGCPKSPVVNGHACVDSA
jgi:site-specific recombinase XerD